MNIPELQTAEWIETLEPFQQALIKNLLLEHSEEETISLWLTVSGPLQTASFGGDGNQKYLKNFKEEFDKMILGDSKYQDIVNEFNGYANVSKFFVVTFLSDALSEHLGTAANVIAPLIVLSLGVIGRIGLNAYKNAISQHTHETHA